MTDFEMLASYITHPDQHKLFRSKRLMREWANAYPMLFDEDDVRIAENQVEMGYHFYEWTAAILVYHTLGMYSLNQQYQYRSHQLKREKLRILTSEENIAYMARHPEHGYMSCPDLLIYSPDYSRWLYAEVKGPSDKLTDRQIAFFRDLSVRTQKPVKIINIEFIPWQADKG